MRGSNAEKCIFKAGKGRGQACIMKGLIQYCLQSPKKIFQSVGW